MTAYLRSDSDFQFWFAMIRLLLLLEDILLEKMVVASFVMVWCFCSDLHLFS
jgi:hypothetical protein